ncbi:hypothetical protein ACFL5X_04340, partial [Candidatus Omnitrophota bacterium]
SIVQAPFDPQSLNRYSYCRNNPLKYTDPGGHIFGLIVAFIAKAAIVGATVGAIGAAITGGNIGMGALRGMTAASFTAAFGGFAGGAITASIFGDDVGIGALVGGIGAIAGGLLGSWVSGWNGGSFWGGLAASAVAGAVAGGIGAELSGGSFGDGASMGAAYGAGGYLASVAIKNLASGSEAQAQDAKREAPKTQKTIDAAQAEGGVEGRAKAGQAVNETAAAGGSRTNSTKNNTAGRTADTLTTDEAPNAVSFEVNESISLKQRIGQYLSDHALQIRDLGRATKNWGLACSGVGTLGVVAGLVLTPSMPVVGLSLSAGSAVFSKASLWTAVTGAAVEWQGNRLLYGE